ncbi:ATP-binding protein [Mesorhizobium sp. M1121]|uniref:ATP-binding protein n=1 Tax=Mesorhizobium sp. M1121 TaxID=2957058 RepID=UPI00333A4E5D
MGNDAARGTRLPRLVRDCQTRRATYRMATKLGQFPFVREPDGFEWAAQPSVDQRQIRELATCRWTAHGEALLLLGPPGTGKKHLAVSIGREAMRPVRHRRKLMVTRAKAMAMRRCGVSIHPTLCPDSPAVVAPNSIR